MDITTTSFECFVRWTLKQHHLNVMEARWTLQQRNLNVMNFI